MVERFPKKDYQFPHIRFNERTVSPKPVQKIYRDTIGIVGEFKKGPSLARINNRRDFQAIFGEDDSSGSLAVQQAMLQGANKFVISRAVPTATKSNAVIPVQRGGGRSQTFEAVVGDNSDASITEYTIGFSLDFSFISEPFSRTTEEFGTVIETATYEEVEEIPFTDSSGNFLITGNFSIRNTIEEYIDWNKYFKEEDDGGNTVDVLKDTPYELSPSNNNLADDTKGPITLVDIYLLEISSFDSGNNSNKLKDNLKPGLIIRDTADPQTISLEIYSYPWIEGSTLKVFVKPISGTFDTASPTSIYVAAPSHTDTGHYVVSHSHNTVIGDSLPNAILNQPTAGIGNGFTIIRRDEEPEWKGINYIELHAEGDNENHDLYKEYPTRVNFRIGDPPNNARKKPNGNYVSLSPNFFINEKVTFTIDVLNSEVTIGSEDVADDSAFNKGLRASSILDLIDDRVSEDPFLSRIIDEIELQKFALPFNVNIKSSFTGREANRINYLYNRHLSADPGPEPPDDIEFDLEEGTWNSFLGARSSASFADRIFYDSSGNPLVIVQSLTKSVEGDNITLSITPFEDGVFELNVFEESSDKFASETYTLSNGEVDSRSGLYRETSESSYIRAYFIPVVDNLDLNQAILNSLPERIAPPNPFVTEFSDPRYPVTNYNKLKRVSLRGGLDNFDNIDEAVKKEEYLEAVNRIEGEDVSVVVITGFDVGQAEGREIVNAAVSQANNSSPFNGLRIAVAAAPSNISKSLIKTISSFYNEDRLVIVAGWSSFNLPNGGLKNISPVGAYAGKLISTLPSVNPNARGGVSGVVGNSLRSDPEFLDALTRGGLEGLYFDGSTNSFKFLNGRTTQKNGSRKWISIRRIGDHIITNLRNNLNWARSQPNVPEIRSRVASGADAYLENLVQKGLILSFVPTLVDESNNTPSDVEAGRLNIQIKYTPILPADIISVSVIRDLTESLSI